MTACCQPLNPAVASDLTPCGFHFRETRTRFRAPALAALVATGRAFPELAVARRGGHCHPILSPGPGAVASPGSPASASAGQVRPTGRQHRSAYAPDLAGLPVGFCIRDAPLREVRCGQRSLSLPGAAHGHLHAPASSCDWLFLIDGVSRPAGAVSGRLRLPKQKNGFHVPRTLRFLVCTAPLTGPRAVPPSKQPVIPTALVVDRFGPLSGSD